MFLQRCAFTPTSRYPVPQSPASQSTDVYNIIYKDLNAENSQPADVFQCDQCPFTCGGTAALQLHKTNVHGLYSEIRLRIDTTMCLCCRFEFHARTRLFRHINYRSSRCKDFYLQHVDPMEKSVAKRLDSQATADVKAIAGKQLRRKPAFFVPYVYALGHTD